MNFHSMSSSSSSSSSSRGDEVKHRHGESGVLAQHKLA